MQTTIKTELIDNYIRDNKISKSHFCRLCKIGRITLDKIYFGNDNVSIIAAFKIAKVLNIKASELFNK